MLYTPTSSENIATGIVGIIIFLLLNAFSILSLRLSWNRGVSKLTKRFFTCIFVMSVFELPRYFLLVLQGSYTSKLGYSLHILGGIFFFAAFSIVCRQWSGLLRLGSYFKGLYGNQGLLLSNVFFGCIDVLGIITCSLSPSLQSFFASTPFAVFTFIEGMRNILYSSFLSFYGLKLISRFWHFSQLERHRGSTRFLRSNSSVLDLCDFLRTLQVDSSESVFKIVVVRVTTVLMLCTVCFVSRVIMLSLKMAALHDTSAAVTAQGFSLFGFLWFTFSDFIPRALPSAVCLLLLTLRKPGSRSSQSASVTQESNGDDTKQLQVTTPGKRVGRYSSRMNEAKQGEVDGGTVFQFVRLTGDEMDLEYDAASPICVDGRGDRHTPMQDAFSTDAALPLSIRTPAYSPLDKDDRIDSDLKKGILHTDLFMEEGEATSPLAAETGRSLLWTGDLEEDEEDEDESDDFFMNGAGGQRKTLDRLLSMLTSSGERQPLDIEPSNRGDVSAAQKNKASWYWGHS